MCGRMFRTSNGGRCPCGVKLCPHLYCKGASDHVGKHWDGYGNAWEVDDPVLRRKSAAPPPASPEAEDLARAVEAWHDGPDCFRRVNATLRAFRAKYPRR